MRAAALVLALTGCGATAIEPDATAWWCFTAPPATASACYHGGESARESCERDRIDAGSDTACVASE